LDYKVKYKGKMVMKSYVRALRLKARNDRLAASAKLRQARLHKLKSIAQKKYGKRIAHEKADKNRKNKFIWKSKKQFITKNGVQEEIITQTRVRNMNYGKKEKPHKISTWTISKKHPRPLNSYDPHYHKKKYIRWRDIFLFGKRMTKREAKYYLYRYADLQKLFGKKNYRAAIKHWRTKGRKERRNKLAYKELTDDQAKCYLKRYPEVNVQAAKSSDALAFARKHYFMWGYYEHRNRYCAPRMTDIQANCYIRRYPDMQQKYHGDIRSARRHWYLKGFKENRNMTCPDSTGPKKCANYGETCRCKGTIHMGRSLDEQLQPNDKKSINDTINWN
jgi:hypothetical protein